MAVSDRIESRTGVARICAAALFALAGVLFVVYPVVRPYAAGGAPDGRAELPHRGGSSLTSPPSAGSSRSGLRSSRSADC
ncbi:hypothetical protein [Rhodococcus opacus]|uniref:hypothetical protein n=1 Tax=Rhodococcus opacus TaxID=37919 RepID=UPI001F5A34E6|nr:hypothetical protein [Rhodococcus opacus]UNM99866.1 hypothetical protein MOO23_30075 [Rhodococcus opacus]